MYYSRGKKVHLEKTVGCKKQISKKKKTKKNKKNTEVKYTDSKNA